MTLYPWERVASGRVSQLVLTVLVVCAAAFPAASMPVVLDFDSISIAPEGTIPNGHGGFVWTNFGFINGSVQHPVSGFANGTVSESYTAFNQQEGQFSAASQFLFDLNSAHLTAAWNDGLSVVVTGLSGGDPLFERIVVIDTTAPTFVEFNFAAIDEVRFTAFGGTNPGLPGSGARFALDDFSYTAVPEPASGALLIGGVVALGWIRRRTRGAEPG